MLQNANSSVSEDEPMEYTVHSSVAHNAIGGLDTIIQSINRRYEVYQKRRTAMTPFSTPAEAALVANNPPTPRPILSESAMVTSSANGSGNVSTMAKQSASLPPQPPRDVMAESIVVANAHPAPYWEERELYIAAEDLCCYLNGGVNYRLLCEQYQRALEVLLSLVKEDVSLCATGAVEVVPGGTASVMGKLQALLLESRRMLEETGVEVPQKLSGLLEHAFPAAATTAEEPQQVHNAQQPPSSETPPATRHSNLSHKHQHHHHHPLSTALVAAMGAANTAGTSPAKAPSPRARPQSALTFGRRHTPASNSNSNGGGGSEGAAATVTSAHDASAQPQPPQPARVMSAGASNGGRRPPQTRNRASLSTPDSTHLPVHFSFSGNGPGAAGGPGMRRNTPSSAVIVDPPESNTSHSVFSDMSPGALDPATLPERHGSILRYSTTGGPISLPSSCAPTPTSNASTAPKSKSDNSHGCIVVAHPPSEEPPAGARRPSRDGGAADNAETVRADDSAIDCVSPLPNTPPPPLDTSYPDSQQMSLEPLENGNGGNAAAAFAMADTSHHLRGRLRALEELYGEHYAMDGMALLTDALGVVFTREYDQGQVQQYQNGFTAFQRDVHAKVMPAMQSYDALQLRTTELTPLRSAYLTSCLARRVRPHDAVLEQLKRIDADRTPETLLLEGLHLGDLGTTAVVESIVPRLYRLRTLNLSDNNVHDGVLIRVLAALRYHPALETLDLSRNPITDDALPSLLRIAQTVPRLSSIILQSCGMSATSKQMVEAEVSSPGTYAVSAEPARRTTSASFSRVGSRGSGVVGVLPVVQASASRAPHPPTAHRPPSSVDGRNRWSPKSSARAESTPSKVTAATRKAMTLKEVGLSTDSKLPPLPGFASAPSTRYN